MLRLVLYLLERWNLNSELNLDCYFSLLQWEDFLPQSRALAPYYHLTVSDLVGNSLKIRKGKGGKDRIVYLPDSAVKVIEDWLQVRGKETGALICHINKSGAVTLRQLTPQAVLFILQKRGKEAGVENFAAHDFRRTFISELLDNTDIVTVQKLAGHASPELTSRYDRRGETVKQKAVQAISVPNRRQ
ncbi:MAG: site-specific integrase [Sphaerospermopsis sp. SIO1G2]|nr:site-specific integrase [Sphaerospermopsis sp. SIO1G2]